MKKIIWTTFLALTVTLAACGSPSTPPPVLTDVPASPATGLITSGGVVASAEAVPARETQMSFVISAPVKEVLVKVGDAVITGQPLLTLYSPDLELAVTSAELELQAAEFEFSYWIPARHDRPPERRQQAEAEVEYARAKLETAKVAFTQSSLMAPFDATVVDVNVQAGEFAQAGQVVITLGDIARMQIETTDLSERDVPSVKIGQSANVYIEALDAQVTGKVILISPISNTVGGDIVYPVTIELDQQLAGLLWGMTAEVEIQTQ
jgi:multidrug efflux pump subunit AcrA (membrane-fusion protein)